MLIKFTSYASLLRKLLEEVLHNNKRENQERRRHGIQTWNQFKTEVKGSQNDSEREVQDGRCVPGIKDTVKIRGHEAFKRGVFKMKLIKRLRDSSTCRGEFRNGSRKKKKKNKNEN